MKSTQLQLPRICAKLITADSRQLTRRGSFWSVCLHYNVNDNTAIEHTTNTIPSRNLTAEVVDIQHIYNDMPKNPRYWWPTIFLEIYRSTLGLSLAILLAINIEAFLAYRCIYMLYIKKGSCPTVYINKLCCEVLCWCCVYVKF